jgi:biopolymer transport protein TolR
MRLPPSERKRLREPIGPLVDVVFLLLVFFLLAGNLEPPPPIEVNPPESENADAQDRGSLRILLDAEGRIAFDGKVRDRESLFAAIDAHTHSDRPRAALVEADSRAAAGEVLALLRQLRALGIEGLELATYPRSAITSDDG